MGSHECDMALAAGVTVMADPGLFVEFSRRAGFGSRCALQGIRGRRRWNQLGRGHGGGRPRRLTEARRNRHPVLALVKGSAINNDGPSAGLTAPNGLAQRRVIRQALADAGVGAADVDVVEAHGTGTKLGDPIEADALLATYGQDRDARRPLRLGSLKSNIGHTQAASGLAGLVKLVLALQHNRLPRTLHIKEPSKEVDWSRGAVSLQLKEESWERIDRPRRGGVSSFGISGSNAHVIIEEAPPAREDPSQVDAFPAGEDLSQVDAFPAGEDSSQVDALPARVDSSQVDAFPACDGDGGPAPASAQRRAGESDRAAVLPWPISGADAQALGAQADKLAAYARANPDVTVEDIGVSLASRSSFKARAVVLGGDREALLDELAVLARGGPRIGTDRRCPGRRRSDRLPSRAGSSAPRNGTRALRGVSRLPGRVR